MKTNKTIIIPKKKAGINIDQNSQLIELDSNVGDLSFSIKGVNLVTEEDRAKAETYDVLWYIVTKGGPNFEISDFNTTTKTGGGINFPAFYSGGAMAYIETIKKGFKPSNKKPEGWFVTRKSSPAIVGVEWRGYSESDSKSTLINDKLTYKGSQHGFNAKHLKNEVIEFGSWVQLHIYTRGMYGYDLQVKLYDKTIWIFENEELKPAAGKYSIPPKNSVYLQGEVSSYLFDCNTPLETKLKDWKSAKPMDGVATDETSLLSLLRIKERLTPKEKDSKETFEYLVVQKAVIDVFVPEHYANTFSSNSIKLKPEITYHNKDGNQISIKHDQPILEFNVNGNEQQNKPKSGISPVTIGNIPTNMAEFHPCKYTSIKFNNYKDPTAILFSDKDQIDHTFKPIETISKQEGSEILVYLEGFDAKECGKPNEKHKENPFKPLLNISADKDNAIENFSFDAKPPKINLLNIIKAQGVAPNNYAFEARTCRHKKRISVNVYPDVEITINVAIGVDEDKYLYVKQTDNYNKRKYKGKKKTKEAKKKHNKRKKEEYIAEVDDKVTKETILKEYGVSVSAEYSIDGGETINFELDGSTTVEQIIESILYVYHLIDSFTFGTTLEDAEKNDKKDSSGNSYEKNSKKRKKKRKKGKMSFVDDLPLRFEIAPPKFTGGVTWKYVQSKSQPHLIGEQYEFILKADPLMEVKGKLDLLFAAQFIPYVNVVVKALDRTVAAVNTAGDVLEFFGVGNMEADYYFDLVITAGLEAEAPLCTYHTIDGFVDGEFKIDSPMSIGLEAGGSILVEVFDLKGEAVIEAKATAKFCLHYISSEKQPTFEFEGIEAIVTAKLTGDDKGDEDNTEEENTQTNPEPEKEKPVKILNGFSIELPLFNDTYFKPEEDE